MFFGEFWADLLFFLIPAVLLVLFGVCLYRYVSARRRNKREPGSFTPTQMRTRFVLFVLSGVVAITLAAIVLGLMLLLFLAVAYM